MLDGRGPGIIATADAARIPLPDNSVDMIFADPPYVKGQRYLYGVLAREAMRVLKPGKFVAAMCGGEGLNEVMRWFDDAGLTYYWLYQLGMTGQYTGIVWKNGNRQVPISTRTKHVLVYSKGNALSRTATIGLYWLGGKDKRWHFWGQPVDSHRYYIDCFSYEGDLILDPFAGGGTTGVACSILNRRFILFDLAHSAVQICKRRLSGEHEPLDDLPLFKDL